MSSPDLRERLHQFGEADGTQFSLFVFLLFGMVMVPSAWRYWDAAMLAYAMISLTVVRMVPVWLSLLGSGLDVKSVLFVGWSGPRGIAACLSGTRRPAVRDRASRSGFRGDRADGSAQCGAPRPFGRPAVGRIRAERKAASVAAAVSA